MSAPAESLPTAPAEKRSFDALLSRLGGLRSASMLVALLIVVAFFQVTTDGVMLKPLNVTNVFLQNGYILVMALGMLLVIVVGHIDLSVGSVAGFLGAVAAVLMVKIGIDPIIAVLLTLVAGGCDRPLAGLLDRVPARALVHRHARRHAPVPGRHAVAARRPAGRAVPRELPRDLAPGSFRS